jgi:hypothetical protein
MHSQAVAACQEDLGWLGSSVAHSLTLGLSTKTLATSALTQDRHFRNALMAR